MQVGHELPFKQFVMACLSPLPARIQAATCGFPASGRWQPYAWRICSGVSFVIPTTVTSAFAAAPYWSHGGPPTALKNTRMPRIEALVVLTSPWAVTSTFTTWEQYSRFWSGRLKSRSPSQIWPHPTSQPLFRQVYRTTSTCGCAANTEGCLCLTKANVSVLTGSAAGELC
jgi:hypothetical protein